LDTITYSCSGDDCPTEDLRIQILEDNQFVDISAEDLSIDGSVVTITFDSNENPDGVVLSLLAESTCSGA